MLETISDIKNVLLTLELFNKIKSGEFEFIPNNPFQVQKFFKAGILRVYASPDKKIIIAVNMGRDAFWADFAIEETAGKNSIYQAIQQILPIYPILKVQVHEDCIVMPYLEKLGFVKVSSFFRISHDFKNIKDFKTPEGFITRSLQETEKGKFIQLVNSVFSKTIFKENYFESVLQIDPDFSPHRIYVIDFDGRLAAACPNFANSSINQHLNCNRIRMGPIVTLPEFRKYGLGFILCCYSLKQLKKMGFDYAYGEVDPQKHRNVLLYKKLGFVVTAAYYTLEHKNEK